LRLIVVYVFIVLIAIVVILGLHSCINHIMVAENESLLTSFPLPKPDAFFLLAVGGAALFPLVVALFFPGGGRAESEPNSLPGSSTSIAMESTDPASSSSASARVLPPRLVSGSISDGNRE
jgi:hypothetical protein